MWKGKEWMGHSGCVGDLRVGYVKETSGADVGVVESKERVEAEESLERKVELCGGKGKDFFHLYSTEPDSFLPALLRTRYNILQL